MKPYQGELTWREKTRANEIPPTTELWRKMIKQRRKCEKGRTKERRQNHMWLDTRASRGIWQLQGIWFSRNGVRTHTVWGPFTAYIPACILHLFCAACVDNLAPKLQALDLSIETQYMLMERLIQNFCCALSFHHHITFGWELSQLQLMQLKLGCLHSDVKWQPHQSNLFSLYLDTWLTLELITDSYSPSVTAQLIPSLLWKTSAEFGCSRVLLLLWQGNKALWV